MPEINTPLLLDLLLALVVLLFVPFGIRRGAAKEAMVSAGVLFGAAIGAAWAERWGDFLAAEFGLDPGTARFGVAAAALFGGAFVLGYGGGAALGRVRQGVLSHLVGGLLAALNAAMLLGFLLSAIDRSMQPLTTLDDGVLADALLREFDRLLVGAGALLLVVVVVGWFITTFRQRRQPPEPSQSPLAAVPPRQRPVRVAREGDAGKYEPGPLPGTSSGRYGESLGETTPLHERPPPHRWSDNQSPRNGSSRSWPTNSPTNSPTNGHSSDRDPAPGWLRRTSFTSEASGAERPTGHSDAPPRSSPAWGRSTSGQSSAVPRTDTSTGDGGWQYGGESETTAPAGDFQTRCPVCGVDISSRDVFCAACGTTL